MGVGALGRVAGVCAGGRFIRLVHQSVDGVKVLVAAAALGGPSLTAAITTCLGPPGSPVAALTLDSAGCHGLLIGTVIQTKIRRLAALALRTAVFHGVDGGWSTLSFAAIILFCKNLDQVNGHTHS